MQRPEIFTGDVGLEKNDRLGTMHTPDHRRSIWISGFIPQGLNSNRTVTMLRLLTSTLCYTRSMRGGGEVGGAHYPKWRRSLLIDFHSRCGIGEEPSLGDDAHLAIVDQFGINISGFTPSFEALGRLLKKRRRRRRI